MFYYLFTTNLSNWQCWELPCQYPLCSSLAIQDMKPIFMKAYMKPIRNLLYEVYLQMTAFSIEPSTTQKMPAYSNKTWTAFTNRPSNGRCSSTPTNATPWNSPCVATLLQPNTILEVVSSYLLKTSHTLAWPFLQICHGPNTSTVQLQEPTGS